MKYGKHMAVRRTSRFMAHDEDQICEPGDVVEIRSVFFLQRPNPTPSCPPCCCGCGCGWAESFAQS